MKKSNIVPAIISILFYGGFIYSSNAQVVPGDIIITEFMVNPLKVADNAGEWIEIYNLSASPLNINGLRLKDNGTNNHLIDNGGPLTIPAGSYMILGINSNTGQNGGVIVDYVYTNFTLANVGDAIILADNSGSTVIDEVSYTTSVEGKSWNLDPGHYSSLDNNDPSNWCQANSLYGDGDYGTPRAANTSCSTTGIDSMPASDKDYRIIVHENVLQVCLPESCKWTTWIIVDLLGKTLASGSCSGQTEYTIDISALSRGTYLFGFQNNKAYKRFIVK
jgi:hypothetical protein